MLSTHQRVGRGAMTEQTDTGTCKYPGCDQLARQAPKTGRPPGYCDNTEHTGVTAWRERKRLAAVERGVTTSAAETEQPVTMARVAGTDLLRQMSVLASTMTSTAGRLIEAVETIGDTKAAEAEVESVRAAAERRAVTAEDERAAAELRVVDADQRAATADEAADLMSEHLAAEVARAREAHDRLAEATAAHAAELERIREETQARIALAEEDRDSSIAAAEAAKAAAIRAADARAEQAEARAQEAIAQARAEAEALVRVASEARDQALAQTAQADQRTAAAEARAEDARAEAARVREDAAREAGQLRADAARERAGLEVQARVLEESRSELRVRAERAERDLDAVRAELTRLRQED